MDTGSSRLSGGLAKVDRDIRRAREQLEYMLVLCRQDVHLDEKVLKISGWSTREHLLHLGIVGNMILDGVERSLADPDRETPSGPARSVRGYLVLMLGRIPRGRAKAPEATLPVESGNGSLETRLVELQGRLESMGTHLEQIALVRKRSPHPMLGGFTPSDWLRFLGIHQEHHLQILREVLRALERVNG